MRIVSPAEKTLLELLCVTYDKWRKAETRMDEVAYLTQLTRMNSELGLSYISRSRISVGKKEVGTEIKQRSRA